MKTARDFLAGVYLTTISFSKQPAYQKKKLEYFNRIASLYIDGEEKTTGSKTTIIYSKKPPPFVDGLWKIDNS